MIALLHSIFSGSWLSALSSKPLLKKIVNIHFGVSVLCAIIVIHYGRYMTIYHNIS